MSGRSRWADCQVRNGKIGLGLGMESTDERLWAIVVVVVHDGRVASAMWTPVPESTGHWSAAATTAAGTRRLVLLVKHTNFDPSLMQDRPSLCITSLFSIIHVVKLNKSESIVVDIDAIQLAIACKLFPCPCDKRDRYIIRRNRERDIRRSEQVVRKESMFPTKTRLTSPFFDVVSPHRLSLMSLADDDFPPPPPPLVDICRLPLFFLLSFPFQPLPPMTMVMMTKTTLMMMFVRERCSNYKLSAAERLLLTTLVN